MSAVLSTPVPTASGIALFGQDPVSQILTGLALVVILYVVLSAGEYIYNSFTRMWRDRVELFPNTYSSGSMTYTAIQNPTNPLAKTIRVSDNQRYGVEFSYAMFVNLSSSTFGSGNKQLLHILHKGYSTPFPLMCPGIFACGERNAIRIFMNSYDTWLNYVDIENIPVDLWFHLVVSVKGTSQYVYVNGNLKSKVTISDNTTPPYQNYGDVYLFSSRKNTINSSKVMSLSKDVTKGDSVLNHVAATSTTPPISEHDDMVFAGSATGMASRVYYFAYALTYGEIQSLMTMGPSTQVDATNMTISPYLASSWWTNNERS